MRRAITRRWHLGVHLRHRLWWKLIVKGHDPDVWLGARIERSLRENA